MKPSVFHGILYVMLHMKEIWQKCLDSSRKYLHCQCVRHISCEMEDTLVHLYAQIGKYFPHLASVRRTRYPHDRHNSMRWWKCLCTVRQFRFFYFRSVHCNVAMVTNSKWKDDIMALMFIGQIHFTPLQKFVCEHDIKQWNTMQWLPILRLWLWDDQ